MDSSFYVTLPSDASMTTYTTNTMTNYVTDFYQPIQLIGSFEVALVEASLPQIINVNTFQGFLEITNTTTKLHTIKMPINTRGLIGINFEGLLSAVNKIIYDLKVRVHGDANITDPSIVVGSSNRYELKVMADNLTLKIFGNLALFFGFPLINENTTPESIPLSRGAYSSSKVNLKTPKIDKNGIVLARAFSHNITRVPDSLYLYTDIIDYQYIGDGFKQLLRNIHIDESLEKQYIIYDFPHYVPVTPSGAINNIQITIKDGENRLVDFKSGANKVILKLHFRPRRNGL
jgi:hypothetical protein